ncbi:oligosaccharide flippase family protein [Cohnella rhizosphaerae]
MFSLFFIVVLTIITGGLPLAVAKLVAAADSRGDAEEAVRIRRTALTLALSASLTVCGLCFALSDWISSSLMTDPRVHTAFLAIIPVIPLVAVSAIWRGYFQGKQDMLPTAVSQTVETIVRIALSLTLAFMFLPWGLEAAAAGAMIGTGAGELAGLAALWLHLRGETRGRGRADGSPSDKAAPEAIAKLAQPAAAEESRTRALLRIAVPVTGSRLIGSLSYLFESILTARALIAAGLATAAATAQYGILQGMVIPLLLLPGSLTFSLATSLVPSLSEAAARGDRPAIQKRLHQSMRLAIVTGAPLHHTDGVVRPTDLRAHLRRPGARSLAQPAGARSRLFVHAGAAAGSASGAGPSGHGAGEHVRGSAGQAPPDRTARFQAGARHSGGPSSPSAPTWRWSRCCIGSASSV